MSSTGKGEGKRSANGKSKDDKGSNKVKGKNKDDRGSNKDKVSDKGEGKGSGKGKSKSKDDKGSINDQGIRKDKSKDDNKGSNKVKCKSKDDVGSNKEEGSKDKGVKRKRGAVGGGLQIIVITGAWEDIWVDVDVKEDDKIKNVKSNIAKVLQWPCNLELELEYKGEVLKDTRTLRDYHVENESRLYVRLALQSLGSDYTIQQ
jgi:hypothetical protein